MTFIIISSFLDAGGIRFSLRNMTYQNNSLVALEDIGEGDNALHCRTDQTACCQHPYSTTILGNWFFPNGTVIPDAIINANGTQWDFYRNRGQMVVRMNRRKAGVTGVHSCTIPDVLGVHQTIYIGVYTAGNGKPLF